MPEGVGEGECDSFELDPFSLLLEGFGSLDWSNFANMATNKDNLRVQWF
jgi:hypothetical protein